MVEPPRVADAEAAVTLTEELRAAVTSPELRASFVAAAQTRERHDDPERRMRVLAAIFADTRRVSFDVARLLC